MTTEALDVSAPLQERPPFDEEQDAELDDQGPTEPVGEVLALADDLGFGPADFIELALCSIAEVCADLTDGLDADGSASRSGRRSSPSGRRSSPMSLLTTRRRTRARKARPARLWTPNGRETRRRKPPEYLCASQVREGGPCKPPFLWSERQTLRRGLHGRPQGTLQEERGEVARAAALVVGAVTQAREHLVGHCDRDTGWDWLNRSRHSFAGCYSTVIGVAILAGVVRKTVSDSLSLKNAKGIKGGTFTGSTVISSPGFSGPTQYRSCQVQPPA
jgi:hypothetical protein